jgi:hypothetical protein
VGTTIQWKHPWKSNCTRWTPLEPDTMTDTQPLFGCTKAGDEGGSLSKSGRRKLPAHAMVSRQRRRGSRFTAEIEFSGNSACYQKLFRTGSTSGGFTKRLLWQAEGQRLERLGSELLLPGVTVSGLGGADIALLRCLRIASHTWAGRAMSLPPHNNCSQT